MNVKWVVLVSDRPLFLEAILFECESGTQIKKSTMPPLRTKNLFCFELHGPSKTATKYKSGVDHMPTQVHRLR